jgi:very-short-patch-repair endonuclease
LRSKQLSGVRFYRQRPLLDYIVDFYCPQVRLVIEIDGGQHFNEEGIRADRIRDARLITAGLKVLRFDNRQVLAETDAVMEAITRVVMERFTESPSSSSFPAGGQEGG